jgi:outer membrane protein
MNKVLIGVNALLVAAVAFLFFKVNSLNSVPESNSDIKDESSTEVAKKEVKSVSQVGSTPTGKIAYINIDKLNEESLEISDLVTETKKRKINIEASVESLSMQYQKKMEEYQTSAKAGIATQSEMQAKEKEILALEKEAQNKQLQMDNLSMDINQKNANFQQSVRDFLIKWNAGKYDYILSYSEVSPNMLLGNTTLEITDEIIKELNSEYKQHKAKK